MPINFFSEDVEFEIQRSEYYADWIQQIIALHSHSLEELNYIFTSDEYLLKINQEHLNHDYYTDIITFDNSHEDQKIEGDIFISIDRVMENAQDNHTSFEHELSRVMAHGLLHLLGYNDKTPEEEKVMREKEDACISLQKS